MKLSTTYSINNFCFSIVLVFLWVIPAVVSAQTDGVLIDYVGATRDNSAVLDVRSSTQGALVPRLTLAQRNLISSPATSLLIFQTDNVPGYYYNSGTSGAPVWTRILETTGVGVANYLARWTNPTTLGTGVTYDNGTNVGIGTSTPFDKVNVSGRIRFGTNAVSYQNAGAGAVAGDPTHGIGWGNQPLDEYGIYVGPQETIYAGDYTKLVLNWHTGMKIGASTGYGGVQFYSNSMYASPVELMSIGKGDNHVRVNNYLFAQYLNSTDNGIGSGVTGIMSKAGDNYYRTANANAVATFLNGTTTGPWIPNNGSGDWQIASNSNATSYSQSSLELRETNFAGGGQQPPRLGFHWGGVVASQLSIENSGRIAIRDNPGTGYENFIARDIYADREIYVNNWVRHNDNDGTYWSNNNWHIHPNDAADMNFRVGSGNGGIRGTLGDNTARGYIHWTTSNEIGFLNASRSWSLRVDNAGNTFATASSRAPIFYDSDNTAYYVDPASTTVLNEVGWGTSATRTQTKDDAGAIGTAKSGFYETSAPAPAGNWYSGASSWQHLLETRHSNPGNNYSMQIAGSFFNQDFWVRKTNNNGAQAWSKMMTSNTIFTTFIQWGRTDCPASSSVSIIYSGFAASGHYGHSGSGANMLCLSPSPDWTGSTINDGDQNGGLLYGTEFQNSGYPWNPGVHDYDARCANCLVTGNSATMMVPGTVACPAGWARQYWGYLMSSHYQQTKSEFVCVANNPEATGSNANSDGALWYPVEAEMGSLNGSGQVQNREVVCAVCTR